MRVELWNEALAPRSEAGRRDQRGEGLLSTRSDAAVVGAARAQLEQLSARSTEQAFRRSSASGDLRGRPATGRCSTTIAPELEALGRRRSLPRSTIDAAADSPHGGPQRAVIRFAASPRDVRIQTQCSTS
jgi:hypothetical protein